MKTDKNSQTQTQVRDNAHPELGLPNHEQQNQSTPSATPSMSADNNPQNDLADFGPVIISITRRQLLAEGAQMDVSKMAREAGIRIPVFMTDTVFNAYVKVPAGVECQDEAGRLWDILWMLLCAIKTNSAKVDRLPFQLYVRNENRRPKLVTLHAVIGAVDIDAHAPSLTIMLPTED